MAVDTQTDGSNFPDKNNNKKKKTGVWELDFLETENKNIAVFGT